MRITFTFDHSLVAEVVRQIQQMKSDMSKRADKIKSQDSKFRDQPDVVIKVVARYRAELFFKISRKTKLSRLFNAWTERMETGVVKKVSDGSKAVPPPAVNGTAKGDAASTTSGGPSPLGSMQFIFTHAGLSVDSEQTPEEAGIEDGDEILAVELMDLTEGPGIDEYGELTEPRRQKLRKNWNENPKELVMILFFEKSPR